MIEEAFEVATEFRFDVGSAILGTNQLTSAVSNLDQAAAGAMTNLHYLASGLVAHLGLGAGGLLGILTKAFNVSEEFTSDTMNLAANIGSNFQFLTGHVNGFNEQLESSRAIMGDINRVATASGLSGHELGSVVKTIASPMAKHERLGTNYAGGIALAKNMMMAGEATGVGSRVMTETIARAMTDNMAIHGAVFQRLVGTKAFTDAHIRQQGQLTNMEGGKKIDLLTKALEQLSGGAQFVAYRMNLISTQFTILKDNLETLLKPIGDAIIVPLKKMFIQANLWLSQNGLALGEAIGRIVKSIFGDPEALYVNIRQMMAFKSDLSRAISITNKAILFAWIGSYFKWTEGIAAAVGGLFGLGKGAGFVEILASEGSMIWKIFRLMGTAIMDFLPNVNALLYFFQILSRARAKAEVIDAKEWLTLSPRILQALARLKEAFQAIMLPISMGMEFWSDLLAPIFTTTIWMRLFVNVMEDLAAVMEFVGNIVIKTLGKISGLASLFIGNQFYDGPETFSGLYKNAVKNFKEGNDLFLQAHPLLNGSTPAVLPPHIENHNHIEARFDMREQLEPDRVAFAVTEHLKKLTINAMQGTGSSLHHGFASNK